MVRCLPRLPRAIGAIARRDVDLAPQDRLDAPLARLVMKRDRGKQIAMLGHRQRRHLQLRRAVQQLPDAARAVEQRELRVQVQVDEVGLIPTRSSLVVSS